MTHGEVYALLRRRRDERSAAAHLPFGLQCAQADPRSRTSNQTVQYAKSGYSGQREGPGSKNPNDGAQRPAVGMTLSAGGSGNVPPFALGGADAEAANALLASPTAGHMTVLLTEVCVLHYLAQHATMSNSGSSFAREAPLAMKAVYGPSTVYDLAVRPDNDGVVVDEGHGGLRGAVKAEPAASEPTVRRTTTRTTTRTAATEKAAGTKREEPQQDEEKAAQSFGETAKRQDEVKEALAAERFMEDAVTRTLVGTKSHLRCVGCALAYYEAKGRRQEREWAEGVRRVLGELRTQGYWPPPQATAEAAARNRRAPSRDRHGSSSRSSSTRLSGRKEEERGGAAGSASTRQQARTVSRQGSDAVAPNGRPLLSLPPNPFNMASEDYLFPSSSSSNAHNSTADRPHSDSGFPPPSGTHSYCGHSRNHKGNASPSLSSLLSENEVMTLVMGRPTTSLQVHQLVSGLDARFGGNRAAVEFFVQRIVAVFVSPQL